MKKLFSKDIMITEIYTIHPNKRVALARLRMLRQGIGALPVVDDNKKLVGIITLRDIDLAGEETYSLAVEDLMTTELITRNKDTPLDEIIDIMIKTGIQRIPIIDNYGKIIGLMTQTVLIKGLKELLKE